ncbi:phage tail-collar fiber domain-containing protein [Cohnella nanjingensis]|uniref:Phage tail protein n=1 Tax=Cohnella nanjingensis TaxID=1387779 RepID=A0A7X0RN00_9BACL|nr:phage tail protein [Cohnella nanjingensis]MBB6670514.1 phage tail protein [Cohnella nanjingensis]
MAVFNGMTLTNKGLVLQGKAQAGATLHYTRYAVGDGSLTGQAIPALNGLISPRLSLPINRLRTQPPNKAIVGTVLNNSSVTTGFFMREIGLFANDPDIGEILYAYANAGATADYIAPSGGADVIERTIDSVVVVGTASNITATIDESLVFARQAELEAHKTAASLDHPDESVTTAKLAAKSVNQAKIADKAVGATQLADGAATDTVIGNRTADPNTTAAYGLSGSVTALFSWILKYFKAITGKSNPFDTPDITLASAKAHVDAIAPHSGHAVTVRKINTSAGLQGGGDLSADRTLSIADDGVTDAKFGNRMIDDTVTATVDADTPTRLWSKLAFLIKAITGKANWFTPPKITLEAASASLDTLSSKKEDRANKNQPGGYAGLDALGQLPSSVFGSNTNAATLGGRPTSAFGQNFDVQTADLNTLVQSGFYRLGGNNANAPVGVQYGQLLVIHGSGDTVTQIVTGYNSDNIFWRSGNPPAAGGVGNWNVWRRVWHSGIQGNGSGVDVDTVDGYHAATGSTASTVAARDAAGGITAYGFTSTRNDGAAPIIVNSQGWVGNLNADMVDGLHASNIARYGGGVTSTTLNSQNADTGMYNISDGSTIGLTADWYHVIHMRHVSNDGYAGQLAIRYFGAGEMYFRSANGTTWGAWKKVVTEGGSSVLVAAQAGYNARYVRNTFMSTGDPSGGQPGDIWIKYQ